jgi:hypothetical protein
MLGFLIIIAWVLIPTALAFLLLECVDWSDK